jgi:hypothetical protein
VAAPGGVQRDRAGLPGWQVATPAPTRCSTRRSPASVRRAGRDRSEHRRPRNYRTLRRAAAVSGKGSRRARCRPRRDGASPVAGAAFRQAKPDVIATPRGRPVSPRAAAGLGKRRPPRSLPAEEAIGRCNVPLPAPESAARRARCRPRKPDVATGRRSRKAQPVALAAGRESYRTLRRVAADPGKDSLPRSLPAVQGGRSDGPRPIPGKGSLPCPLPAEEATGPCDGPLSRRVQPPRSLPAVKAGRSDGPRPIPKSAARRCSRPAEDATGPCDGPLPFPASAAAVLAAGRGGTGRRQWPVQRSGKRSLPRSLPAEEATGRCDGPRPIPERAACRARCRVGRGLASGRCGVAENQARRDRCPSRQTGVA